MEDEVRIELPDLEEKTVIKIIGVGGGGGNAVNHMFNQGIHNVDFLICNTDKQALNASPIQSKILLGESGLGAGNKPEEGRKAAEASADKIKALLSDSTEMVFITAGMGGGTGTGAAPVIADIAKSMGILTVAIVTIPFLFEGPMRITQALRGVEEMRKHVDSILIINTEKLNEIYPDTSLRTAFAKADDILTTAAKGIAEMITRHGYVNCDLNDVRTTMRDSGDAVMGSAEASGPNRARLAIENALNSPLLLSTDLKGARNILLNISYGNEGEMTTNELSDITNYITERAGYSVNQILWGDINDETLGDSIRVTIVATGFDRVVEKSLDQATLERVNNIKAENTTAPAQVTHTAAPTPVVSTSLPNNYKFDPETGLPNPNYRSEAQATQARTEEPKQMPQDIINTIRNVYNVKNYGNSIAPTSRQEVQPVETIQQEEARQTRVVPIGLSGASDEDLDNFDSQTAISRRKGMTNNAQNNVSDDDLSSFTISKKGESFSMTDKNSFINNRPD